MNNHAHIKPEINPEHPRIKNRTPDQQKYRDDLAQVLKANRQLGDVGRRAARVVLENESESAEYISAKENIPQDLAKDILEYISYSKNPEDLEIDRILEKSKGVSHQKIAKILIEKGYWLAVAQNLEKFEGLDSEFAELLIESGWWAAIAGSLEKFEGLDHKKIAKILIEKGRWTAVTLNLEKFEGIDYQKIAELLIESGWWPAIAGNLEKFEGLDHKKIAELLIEKGDWIALAENLEKFEGLDYQKIAELLVEKKNRFTVDIFTNNLEKLKGLDSKTVELLIKKVREAEQRKWEKKWEEKWEKQNKEKMIGPRIISINSMNT